MNITGIVGVAEDTDGALMLTTSDPAATREAFAALGLPYEEHDPTAGIAPGPDDRRRPRSRRVRLGRLIPAGRADADAPPQRHRPPTTVAIRLGLDDAPTAIPALVARVGRGRRHAAQPEHGPPARRRPTAARPASRSRSRSRVSPRTRLIAARRRACPGLRGQGLTRSLERVFGKRVIVVGGGAQVAQVALGAVSEADRHNLRGERISVDTIPLVGEENIAAAVRAVADLPRARLLVLAGSIMGGDITPGRPTSSASTASRSSP